MAKNDMHYEMPNEAVQQNNSDSNNSNHNNNSIEVKHCELQKTTDTNTKPNA